MNLSPAWVEVFRAAGFEAVDWSELGPPNATDAVVFEQARQQGAVVSTNDLDFPAILAATRGRSPSVVQLRSGSLLPTHSGNRVVAILRELAPELEKGAVAVIETARHRVRLLPLP